MGAENDDYNKASIYSILYGLYANAGEVICGGSACGGVPYQFTFNTWGIAGPTLLEGAPKYGPEDPQRHGKAAYTGLVSFPEVKDYMAANGDNPTIVEIGCGTGAGANLITRELIPNAHYIAIDMQFAAIETSVARPSPRPRSRSGSAAAAPAPARAAAPAPAAHRLLI